MATTTEHFEQNQAAWLDHPNRRLEIGTAPERRPTKDHVVVKVWYAGVNPIDWKIQDTGMFVQEWPTILGEDIAGEVVHVGQGIGHVKAGDRVLAFGSDAFGKKNDSAAFQLYALVHGNFVVPLPEHITLEQAAVLPLAVATASHALFSVNHLKVPLPQLGKPTAAGKTVLIWGGASSVGINAIQLAKIAGLKVVATASQHNHGLLKSLGVEATFDYRDPDVVDKIVEAIGDSDFIGAFDTISVESTITPTAKVVSTKGGGKLALTLSPPNDGRDLPTNVSHKVVLGPSLTGQERDLGEKVFRDLLNPALREKVLKPLPPPQIIKGGLVAVQQGLDEQKKGVSAKKIVVELE